MMLPEVDIPAAKVSDPRSMPAVVHRPGRVVGVGDLDEEHRRAVHQHQIARLADAHAERLGPCVDRARHHRGALRGAGRGGGRRVHEADLLAGQTSRGNARSRQNRLAQSVAQAGSGCRRADRTGWRCGGRARTRRSAARRRRCSPEPAGRRSDTAAVRRSHASLGPIAWLDSSVPPRARIASAPNAAVSSSISALARVSTPYRIAGRNGVSASSHSTRQGPTPLTHTPASRRAGRHLADQPGR